jgi:hypothetical protein
MHIEALEGEFAAFGDKNKGGEKENSKNKNALKNHAA